MVVGDPRPVRIHQRQAPGGAQRAGPESTIRLPLTLRLTPRNAEIQRGCADARVVCVHLLLFNHTFSISFKWMDIRSRAAEEGKMRLPRHYQNRLRTACRPGFALTRG